jgi:steroid delta-isomerase-like uncharacterized protein
MSAFNQQAIDRLTNEVLTQHDLGVLDSIFHADYIEADPPPGMGPGVDGLRQWLSGWFAAFPDVSWTVEEQMADGDQVWSRSTWRGTHKADFFGIPATGRAVSVTAWTIDRFADGKITHSRLMMDTMSLLQQLGAIPAPQ